MASIGELFSTATSTIYTVVQVAGWGCFAIAAFLAWKKKWGVAAGFAIAGLVLLNAPIPQPQAAPNTGGLLRP